MNLLETIKERANIVDVIQERLSLNRKGKTIKALCPFHDDKSPSLVISENKQIFKCFSCGMGGDVVKFLMEYDKISFKEALKKLAAHYHISLPKTFNLKNTQYIDPHLKEKTILQTAANAYHRYLLKGKEASSARQYLTKRKITRESLATFKIGYAPIKRDFLTKIIFKKQDEEKLLQTNLIKNDYRENFRDFFNHRIVFPIINEKNETLGFGGRALGDAQEPKYINSSEMPWFKKREILYGFRESYQIMLKKRMLYLVEGYFDVLAFHALNLPAAAPMGTSLTKEQLLKLKRYIDKLYLTMDCDEAGTKANLKAIYILMELEIDAYVITLPKGQDPFDLATNLQEDEVYRYLERHQKPIHEYLLEHYQPAEGTSLIEKKKNFQEIMGYYHVVKDKYLKQNLNDLIKKRFQISAEEYQAGQKIKPRSQQKLIKKPAAVPSIITKERELIIFLCSYPSYIKATNSIFDLEDFSDGLAKHIYKKLLYNRSSNLEKIENILQLFPKPEEKPVVDFIIGKTIKFEKDDSKLNPMAIEEDFKDRISLLKLAQLNREKTSINELILKSIKLNHLKKVAQLEERKMTLIKEQEKLKNFVKVIRHFDEKND